MKNVQMKIQLFCLFHHREGKDFEIASLLLHRWSDIVVELKKCDLLCRNCHNEVHCTEDSRGDKIKQKLLEIKCCDHCEKCGYAGENLASLEFHHRVGSQKKFQISVFLSRRPKDISWEMAILEIDKCDVLCSNCHFLIHFDMERFTKIKPLIEAKTGTYKEAKRLNRKQVEKLLQSGLKQIEIARRFGCAKSTICGIAKSIPLQGSQSIRSGGSIPPWPARLQP